MTTASVLPVLAITMGDPAGVGAEVTVKALRDPAVYKMCRPLVVGSVEILSKATRYAGTGQVVRRAGAPDDARSSVNQIVVLDDNLDVSSVEVGKLSSSAGLAALAYVRRAAGLAQAGYVDGIVTAPLNKEAVTLSGLAFTGHTEYLAEMAGSRVAMMLATETLRVVHVTTHVSLAEACTLVTPQRVLETIHIAHDGCVQLGIDAPRLVVAGLNPHAGEHGLFGTEDVRHIAPAIEQAVQQGVVVSGPASPDTIFWEASQGKYDCVVAMYHDQGHIAIKMNDFYGGVNITLGLPFVRTSVDHGTGFAIAGKGVANERSMVLAIRYAAQMATARMRARPDAHHS